MNRASLWTACAALFFLASQQSAQGEGDMQGWPRWRGPNDNGVATLAKPPITWSESENVQWKVEVPGTGSATPIIWQDRVYVSTAVQTDRTQPAGTTDAEAPSRPRPEAGEPGDRPSGRGQRFGGGRFGGGAAPSNVYQFVVLAYDRASGAEVWRSMLTEQVPHESTHSTNTYASFSPITDGRRIYISFGSRGIFCLDMNGKKVWSVELGEMRTRNQFGEGSSPALHDDILVVPWDHEGESFIVALQADSGKEIWRKSRDEQTTWSTPLITEFQGRTQVITNGSNRVRSYDLRTGELIWECGGQTGNPVPTPVRFEDNVIVMTGFRAYAIYSIPLDSQGDITDTEKVTWFEEDAAPYVPSPVLFDGQLYFVKANNGVLVSRSAKTGELLIDQTRTPDITSVYASPVAANGNIYLTGRNGATLVLKHGASFEVIATNKLEDEIDASAALVDNEIYFRGKRFLYRISERK